MRNKLKYFVTAFGAILTLYSCWYFFKSNYNLGNLLLIFCGLVLLFWNFVPNTKGIKAVKGIICLGALVYVVLIGFIFAESRINKADFGEDAVVVLGCGVKGTRLSRDLKVRLDKTLEYYNENPDCVICVSGGQGPQEDIAEGEAMRDYLTSNGVPEYKIIIENKASSTEQNFAFSKTLLDEYFDKIGKTDYKIAYVTNDFHSYRSGILAKRAGFKDPKPYPSKTSVYSIIPNYLREVLAVLYTWVCK